MKTALLIFAGSGFGGVCRYLVQKYFIDLGFISFPLGTFIVNILGCFLIGLFAAMVGKNNLVSPELEIALLTGFCGGFTTFSSFANESMSLFYNGDYLYFFLYLILSIVLGIAAVMLGINALKIF